MLSEERVCFHRVVQRVGGQSLVIRLVTQEHGGGDIAGRPDASLLAGQRLEKEVAGCDVSEARVRRTAAQIAGRFAQIGKGRAGHVQAARLVAPLGLQLLDEMNQGRALEAGVV